MAEVESVLIAVGVIVGGAFLANLGFRRFRFPEVLFLIGLGVLMGPVLGFVDVEGFRELSPLIGTIAILLILFDGGLEIQLRDLKAGVAQGSLLALLVFTATAVLCAGVGYLVADLPARHALLLGMAFGGAGAVIVMPMIRELGVQQDAVTVVSIEAAVSDVLVIVGVYGLATAIEFQIDEPTEFARNLFVVFALAIVLGTAGGFLWSRVLGTAPVKGYEYVLTMSAIFLLHVATEGMGASGPMAVLAFGLVIGNSKRALAFVEAATHSPRRPREAAPPKVAPLVPVFTETLAGFHHEMVFLIRSFFFVGIGVVLDLDVLRQPRFLLVGFLMAVAVAVGRIWGTAAVFWRSRLPLWDKAAIAVMFPLGLAAAALSLVPYQVFGFEEARDFGAYAAVTIVLTNVFCSAAVWAMGRDRRRPFEAPVARRRPEAPPPPSGPRKPAPARPEPATGPVTFVPRKK